MSLEQAPLHAVPRCSLSYHISHHIAECFLSSWGHTKMELEKQVNELSHLQVVYRYLNCAITFTVLTIAFWSVPDDETLPSL